MSAIITIIFIVYSAPVSLHSHVRQIFLSFFFFFFFTDKKAKSQRNVTVFNLEFSLGSVWWQSLHIFFCSPPSHRLLLQWLMLLWSHRLRKKWREKGREREGRAGEGKRAEGEKQRKKIALSRELFFSFQYGRWFCLYN